MEGRTTEDHNYNEDGHLQENPKALVALLKVCAQHKDLQTGTKVHADILKKGLLGKNPFVASILVNMYAKSSALEKAKEVFEGLPIRDVVAWSTLIAAYAKKGHDKAPVDCFECMQCEGLHPDAVTYVCSLGACGNIGALGKGEKLHRELVDSGLLVRYVKLGNALVDMYVRCGALLKAKIVLDGLPTRDVVSWNTLIAGFVQGGHGRKALDCFKKMQEEGFSPNETTFACILGACGSIKDLDKGEIIHLEIIRRGLLGKNTILGSALVDMYSKCEAHAKAEEVLQALAFKDVVSWNALISGYVQEEHGKEALGCFQQMLQVGFLPNAITFACVLRACGTIGALEKGREVHCEILQRGLLDENGVLGNALMAMYTKCGALEEANGMLEKLPVRSTISWSTMIGGYGHQGHAKEALSCFGQMQREGSSPDEITFLCVLAGCSHAGLLNNGQMCFPKISSWEYSISSSPMHQTCMVDLFGRAGFLNEAVTIMKKMPIFHHPAVWSALLFACQKLGNLKLGRWAFEKIGNVKLRRRLFEQMVHPDTKAGYTIMTREQLE